MSCSLVYNNNPTLDTGCDRNQDYAKGRTVVICLIQQGQSLRLKLCNVSNELLGGVGVWWGGGRGEGGRGFKLALRDPNPRPQLHVYMCAGMDHFLVLCDH